jgi:hypothetical protein
MSESKVLSTLLAKAGGKRNQVPTVVGQDLVDRMALIVNHARAESDLVFPEDATVDACFDIVNSALMDALRQTGDVAEAYKIVFPRVSGRRARTPVKAATQIMEIARASHPTIAEYNREMFARVGLTITEVAKTLFSILASDRVRAGDKIEAIRLINRLCQFEASDRAPAGPSIVVPIQNVMPMGPQGCGAPERRHFDRSVDATDEGKKIRDAIFTEGGGRVNAEREQAAAPSEAAVDCKPVMCTECGIYPADLPDPWCQGCAAHAEHAAI